MHYDLTEEQQAIVETARDIAQLKIKKVREHYDKTEEYPWEIVEELRKADLFGVYIPAEYGGLGGGAFELVLVVEQLSRACGGIALALAGTALGTYPIMLYGTDEQKKKYLPDLASGKRLGAFTITEPEAGSDATAAKATAVLDGDHYILNGTKVYCTNGKAAEIYSLFFSTNPSRGARGVSCFVVEKGTPGFEFGRKEEKMGIRASPTYQLEFNNCRIPKENMIGPNGGGLLVAQATFDVSRPGVAAQALGIAQGAMDEAFAYARTRRQFGQPVISFQAMQHKLANMAMEIEAARALLYQTARLISRGGKQRWTKESAMAKCYCSDVAMRVTVEAVQMCGGIGYMRDFPIEKFMRDAKITQIYEGTNEIQRNEIAMAMIKEAAREGAGKSKKLKSSVKGLEGDMHIIVCIKQTPATANIQIDPKTGTLKREGMAAAINPFDEYAIEEAVRIKEKLPGSTVSVVTMGPPQAEDALRDAIARGCDEAFHVTDRAFAGADTWATSYTLKMAIEKIARERKPFDLIICGKQTNDGDTGHVGPGIAAWLAIPNAAYVGKVEEIKEGSITVRRMMEDGYDVLEMATPALISVVKEINEPRLASLKGKLASKKAVIPKWNAADINADKSNIGLSGSPTIVAKSFNPPPRKGGERIEGATAEEKVKKLIARMKELKVI